ncbi:MAG: alpha/beta fold hydrolase [Clostridia bacterium]|nr:alpha/beta fold hydrolase [Clostridia bacterium]
MEIVLWIFLAIMFLFVLPTLVIAYVIYSVLLVRTDTEKWGRNPSMPDDEEYVRLYAQADEWGTAYAGYKKDVEVKSDGLRLVGEYFDFGGENAVIILPGRMESCTYSYHYAEPYRRAGWNVLTIDARAHGRSEGKINSLGYKEYRDVIVWSKLLHDEFGIKRIVLHGVCIGSSTALFTATAKECPDYVAGVIADGMYQRFYDSCRNHMLYDKRPIFPFLYEVMLHIRVFSGANVVTDGPKKRIVNMRRPIRFLHSREDLFSTPDKAQELYERCPSENKSICWFDHGWHSRLRITDPDKYDGAVTDFLASL